MSAFHSPRLIKSYGEVTLQTYDSKLPNFTTIVHISTPSSPKETGTIRFHFCRPNEFDDV